MRNIEVCRNCPEYSSFKTINGSKLNGIFDKNQEFCDSIILGTDKNGNVQGKLGGHVDCVTGSAFPSKVYLETEGCYVSQEVPEECPYILEHVVLDDVKIKRNI